MLNLKLDSANNPLAVPARLLNTGNFSTRILITFEWQTPNFILGHDHLRISIASSDVDCETKRNM
jgi:hypothetical protein